MKNRKIILVGAIACCMSLSFVVPSQKAQRASADPETYEVSKDFPGAVGEHVSVTGAGTAVWKFQALNLAEFFMYGTLEANATTGQLTTTTSNTTLQLFPMIKHGGYPDGVSTVMYPGTDPTNSKSIDMLVQYPAGNGMATLDSDVGTGS